jgi:hypothetical protein
MEFLNSIIETTINSFDFTYCIIVNILTYIIIKLLDEANGEKQLSIWSKRLVMFISVITVGIVYAIIGTDLKLMFNSAILAPVFWSWVMKPICVKLDIDYKQIKD